MLSSDKAGASLPKLLEGLHVAAWWWVAVEEHGYPNNCRQCRADPLLREIWGCDRAFVDDLAGDVMVYHVGGETYETCPLSRSSDEAVQVAIQLFDAYEKGVLPQQGALTDQPALYCQTMAHISALRAEVQTHVHNKERAKLKD